MSNQNFGQDRPQMFSRNLGPDIPEMPNPNFASDRPQMFNQYFSPDNQEMSNGNFGPDRRQMSNRNIGSDRPQMFNRNFGPENSEMSNGNFNPERQQMPNRDFGPDRQERFVCDVCTNRDTCEHGFQTYRIPRLEELEEYHGYGIYRNLSSGPPTPNIEYERYPPTVPATPPRRYGSGYGYNYPDILTRLRNPNRRMN